MDVWFSVLTTSKLVEQIANQQIYCNPLALEGGCDSGGTRTPNRQNRNLLFYPIELRSLFSLQRYDF